MQHKYNDKNVENQKSEELTSSHNHHAFTENKVITKKHHPRIVAFGDSLTFGYGIEKEEDKWTSIIAKELNCEVINSGVSGHTSSQGLERIKKDVLEKNPDYVIINFGMNDHFMYDYGKARVPISDYENNIITIIDRVRKHGAVPVLVIPHVFIEGNPGDGNTSGADYYYSRHPEKYYRSIGGAVNQLNKYCEAAKKIADEYQVPLVDINSISKSMDLNTILITLENSSEDDGVHINEKGARLYADKIIEVFKQLI
ncbi:SGNH/GDSL hydrolase family protein [Clostridium polynesiense]|uniref:SGNH/GDSL hydrolase family protein n=1 Tax=Clostridium polynesiense TaxID=1325933 RepID=UPI0006949172|nr:GDSL-type esterase/lipase family protein [Clostridium polynesiense]